MRFSPVLLAIPAAALAWALAVANAASPVKIDGVSGELRDGVEKVLPDRDPPQSLFDAERLSEEAAERAQRWLRSEGWYAAEVTADATEEPLAARLRIVAGERFVFAAPVLTFDGAAPDETSVAAARASVERVRAGQPARALDVLNAEAAAVASLRDNGYPDAKAAPRNVVVDHATHTMAASFSIDAGARVRMGAVRVQPEGLLRPGFVRQLPSWKEGDHFKPELLTQLRRDLASTGAFSLVTAELAPAPDGTGTRDVVVSLERAKPRVIELGAGYSTTDGLSAEAAWTKRNFTHRADSLTVNTVLGEQAQSLTATLTQPNAAGAGRALQLAAGISHADSAAFDRTGISLSAQVNAAQRLKFGVSYGVSATADTYARSEGVENAYVLSGFGDVRRDETDSPLDARRGYLLQARLEPSISTGDATVAFARATAQARIYHTPAKHERLTLAARTRVGWIEPIAGKAADLPPDRQFYAGGGGSVRGYDFNSIYPRPLTKVAEPPGGRALLEVSGEARARFTDRIGAVAFVDGGNAFDKLGEAGDLRWGVGAGVRYNLGFAPLRFDVAAPLDRRPTDPKVALYVSIGQAF